MITAPMTKRALLLPDPALTRGFYDSPVLTHPMEYTDLVLPSGCVHQGHCETASQILDSTLVGIVIINHSYRVLEVIGLISMQNYTTKPLLLVYIQIDMFYEQALIKISMQRSQHVVMRMA